MLSAVRLAGIPGEITLTRGDRFTDESRYLADRFVNTIIGNAYLDPQQILDDVRAGLARVHGREWNRADALVGKGSGYVVIEDRREALEFAVGLLRPGDLLLVAGKGHEDYQILASGRIHFDDREELRNALQQGGLQ